MPQAEKFQIAKDQKEPAPKPGLQSVPPSAAPDVGATIHELKVQGREALRLLELAERKSAEAIAESESLSAQAKELHRRAFGCENQALQYETQGNQQGAAEQRRLCAELRAQADEVYRRADAQGELGARLGREAFRQKKIALKTADALKALKASGQQPAS